MIHITHPTRYDLPLHIPDTTTRMGLLWVLWQLRCMGYCEHTYGPWIFDSALDSLVAQHCGRESES